MSVQLTFINRHVDINEFQDSIDITDQGGDADSIWHEYSDMLKNQLAKGNNGLVKAKYITFGIEADSLRDAKMRIERVEADIMANFNKATCGAERISARELEVSPTPTARS